MNGNEKLREELDEEEVFWKEYQRKEDSQYDGWISSIVQFYHSIVAEQTKEDLLYCVSNSRLYSIKVLSINVIILVVFIVLIATTNVEVIGDVNSPKYDIIIQQVNIWLFFSLFGLGFFLLLHFAPNSFRDLFDMCTYEIWINFCRTINVSFLLIFCVKLFRYGPYYHDTCYEQIDLNARVDNSYTFVFLELFVDTIQTVVFTTLPLPWTHSVFLCLLKLGTHLSLINTCLRGMDRSNMKWFVEIAILSMVNIFLILSASSNTIMRSSASSYHINTELNQTHEQHKYRLVHFLSSGVKYPLQCALLSADNVIDSLDEGGGAGGGLNSSENSARIHSNSSSSSSDRNAGSSSSSSSSSSGRSPGVSERTNLNRRLMAKKESLASRAIKASNICDDLLLLLRLQECSDSSSSGANSSSSSSSSSHSNSGSGTSAGSVREVSPCNVRDLFQAVLDASPHQDALQYLRMITPYCSIRADKELLSVLMRHFLLFGTGFIAAKMADGIKANTQAAQVLLNNMASLRITLEENPHFTAKDPAKHCKYLLRITVSIDRSSKKGLGPSAAAAVAAGAASGGGGGGGEVHFLMYVRRAVVICQQLVRHLRGASLNVNETEWNHFELSVECEQVDSSESVVMPEQEGAREIKYEVGLVLLDSVVEGVVRNTLQDCLDVAFPKTFLSINDLLNNGGSGVVGTAAPVSVRLNSFQVLFLDSVVDCKLLKELGYTGLTVFVSCSRAYLTSSTGDFATAPSVVRRYCDYVFPLPCFLLDSKELILWLESPATAETLRKRQRECGAGTTGTTSAAAGAGAGGGGGGGLSRSSFLRGDGETETVVSNEGGVSGSVTNFPSAAPNAATAATSATSTATTTINVATAASRIRILVGDALAICLSSLNWFFVRTEFGVLRIPSSQYENYAKWRLLNPTRSLFHYTNLVTMRLLLYMAHSIVQLKLRGGDLSFGGFNSVLLVSILVVFRRYIYNWMIRHCEKVFSGFNLYYFWSLISFLYLAINFISLVVVLMGSCTSKECAPIFNISGNSDLVGARIGGVFSGKTLIDFITNGGGIFVGWLFHFTWPVRLFYIIISAMRVYTIIGLLVRRFVSDLLFSIIVLMYLLVLIVALTVESHSEHLHRVEYTQLRRLLLRQHLVDWCESVAQRELRRELKEVQEARVLFVDHLKGRVACRDFTLNEDLLRFLNPIHFAGLKLSELIHLLQYAPSVRDSAIMAASAARAAAATAAAASTHGTGGNANGNSGAPAAPNLSGPPSSPAGTGVTLKHVCVLSDFINHMLLAFKGTLDSLGIRLFLDVDPSLTVVRINPGLFIALVSGAVSKAIANILRSQREHELRYIKASATASAQQQTGDKYYRTSSCDTQQEILVIVKPLRPALDDKSPQPIPRFMDTRLMIVNVLDTSKYDNNRADGSGSGSSSSDGNKGRECASLEDRRRAFNSSNSSSGSTSASGKVFAVLSEADGELERHQLEALEGWSSYYCSEHCSLTLCSSIMEDCGRRSSNSSSGSSGWSRSYFIEVDALAHAHYGAYYRFTMPYKLSKESKKASECRASDCEGGFGNRRLLDDCVVRPVGRDLRLLLEAYQQHIVLPAKSIIPSRDHSFSLSSKDTTSHSSGGGGGSDNESGEEKNEVRGRLFHPSVSTAGGGGGGGAGTAAKRRRSILFYVTRHPESLKEYSRYATLFEMKGWKCSTSNDALLKENGTVELGTEALDAILIDYKVGDLLFNVILAARVKYGPSLVIAVLFDCESDVGRTSVFLTEITTVDLNLIKPISPELLIEACNKSVISQLMLMK